MTGSAVVNLVTTGGESFISISHKNEETMDRFFEVLKEIKDPKMRKESDDASVTYYFVCNEYILTIMVDVIHDMTGMSKDQIHTSIALADLSCTHPINMN